MEIIFQNHHVPHTYQKGGIRVASARVSAISALHYPTCRLGRQNCGASPNKALCFATTVTRLSARDDQVYYSTTSPASPYKFCQCLRNSPRRAISVLEIATSSIHPQIASSLPPSCTIKEFLAISIKFSKHGFGSRLQRQCRSST